MDVESLPGEFKQTSLVLMSAPCVGGLLCSASRPLRGGLGVGGQGGGGGWGGGGRRTRADNVGKKTVCIRISSCLRGNFCRFMVLRPGCSSSTYISGFFVCVVFVHGVVKYVLP